MYRCTPQNSRYWYFGLAHSNNCYYRVTWQSLIGTLARVSFFAWVTRKMGGRPSGPAGRRVHDAERWHVETGREPSRGGRAVRPPTSRTLRNGARTVVSPTRTVMQRARSVPSGADVETFCRPRGGSISSSRESSASSNPLVAYAAMLDRWDCSAPIWQARRSTH